MKAFFIFFIGCCFLNQSFSQKKIVLKPGLTFGYGVNAIKNRMTAENSFRSPKPGTAIFLNGRIEFYTTPKNFIDLTIRGTEAAFSFGFSIPELFKYTYQTSVEFTQLNVGYNHLFNPKPLFKHQFKETIFMRTKLGTAIGISNNKPNSYYKEFFYNQFTDLSTSLFTAWQSFTALPNKKIGLYIMARAGLSLYRKRNELFDLVLEYNKGIRSMTNIDVKYNINGKTYQTLLLSRGSNFTITSGIPITVFKRSMK